MPTRYFFKLEHQCFEKSRIDSIYDANDAEVSSDVEITKAHVDFYAELFSRDETDILIQNYLLLNVTHRLSDSDRELCEGDLLLPEDTVALKAMSHNKSPGPDSLTAEFYVKFWDRLSSIFHTYLTRVFLAKLSVEVLPVLADPHGFPARLFLLLLFQYVY